MKLHSILKSEELSPHFTGEAVVGEHQMVVILCRVLCTLRALPASLSLQSGKHCCFGFHDSRK